MANKAPEGWERQGRGFQHSPSYTLALYSQHPELVGDEVLCEPWMMNLLVGHLQCSSFWLLYKNGILYAENGRFLGSLATQSNLLGEFPDPSETFSQ